MSENGINFTQKQFALWVATLVTVGSTLLLLGWPVTDSVIFVGIISPGVLFLIDRYELLT